MSTLATSLEELRKQRELGWEPATIEAVANVRSDVPGCGLRVFAGTVYHALCNPQGAVSAVLPGLRALGLKPGEFRVVTWKRRPSALCDEGIKVAARLARREGCPDDIPDGLDKLMAGAARLMRRLVDEIEKRNDAFPELLDGCQRLNDCIVWRDDLQCYTLAPDKGGRLDEALRVARAAICKATGKVLP